MLDVRLLMQLFNICTSVTIEVIENTKFYQMRMVLKHDVGGNYQKQKTPIFNRCISYLSAFNY